jgi:GH24 family phage-related lysozyme (muramidase)
MNISSAGLQLIETSEGCRTSTYKDVAGYATMVTGLKFLSGESFLDGIRRALTQTLLERDVQGAVYAVNHLVKVPLEPKSVRRHL